MGQYYNIILADYDYGDIHVSDRTTLDTNGKEDDYCGAKLTEHSWIDTYITDAVSNYIHNNPTRIIWCGDYTEEDELQAKIANKLTLNDVFLPEDRENEYLKLRRPEGGFDYHNKWLVNRTKKEQINLNLYMNRSFYGDTWDDGTPQLIYPVSLLAALGNGRGGGDYHEGGTCFDKVGSWAGDFIEITDERQYACKIIDVFFVEEYGQRYYKEKTGLDFNRKVA